MTLPLLVTPGAVRLYPGGARITDDELLLTLIRSTSAAFRRDTHQRIDRVVDDVEVLDGNRSRVLLLAQLPVVAVTAIEVDGVSIGATAGLWNERGIIRRSQAFPDTFRSVRVTYTHGYDPVPEDIAEAIALEVIRRAARAKSATGRLPTQTTTGPFQAAYAPDMGGVTQTWNDVVRAYLVKR